MEEIITQADVVRYIELVKLKYDIELKKICVDGAEKNSANISIASFLATELSKVSQELETLSAKFKRAGFNPVLLSESKINELTNQINSLKREELLSALKSKSGNAYDLLFKRNAMIKQSVEKKDDLAKINILINLLHKNEREALISAIVAGELNDWIKLTCDQQTKNHLVKFMKRIGIAVSLNGDKLERAEKPVPEEVSIVIANKKRWVPELIADEVRTNVERINTLSVKLQVLNAKRQVETFSDNEEADFIAMQEEYLKLLKEQDNLLRDLSKEEDLVYRSLIT